MENFFKFAPDTGADGSAAAAANAGVDIEAKAKADGSTSTKTKIDPAANKKQPINKIFVSAKAGSGIWKLVLGFLIGIILMLGIYYFAVLRGNKLDGDLSEAFKVIDGSVVSVQSLADENIAAANDIEKDQNNILASVDKAKKDLDQIAANATSSKQKAAEVKKNSQQQKEEAKTIKQEAEKVEAAIKQEDGSFKVTTKTPGNVAAKEFSASGAGVDTSSSVFNTPVTEICNNLDKDLYVIFYGDWDGGMMAKIAPGQSLKPGFKFENGKTFRPGVHFSVFSLDNVKKDGSAVSYSLEDLFSFDQKAGCWRPKNTSLGTYYWASGSITVRDGYYKSAMSILAADGKIYDGVAVKRANGTTKAVKSGGVTIVARNM